MKGVRQAARSPWPQAARRRLVAAASIAATRAFAAPASAHVEDSLFVEHPPATAFGALARSSVLAVNDHDHAFTSAVFAEYAPVHFRSFGVGPPWGVFRSDALLSDLSVAVKGSLPTGALKLVPILTVEVPTGSAGATSEHVELVPALFAERMLMPFHLYGVTGGRVALGDDEETHVNALAPHAEREISGTAGVSWWVTSFLGLDGRLQLYVEDLEEVVPQPQAGVVLQVTRPESFTFKASITGFYAPNGIREGGGVGLPVYIKPK